MPAAMPQQLDDDFGFKPDDDDFGFQPDDAPAQEQPVRATLPPLFDTTQTPVEPNREQLQPFMAPRQPETPMDPTSAFADPFPAQPEPEGETAFQGDNEFHYNSRKRTWEPVGNKDAVFDPGLEHAIVPGIAYDRRPVKAFAAGVGRRMASLPAALADISEGEHPLQGGEGKNIEAVMEGRKPSYVADYENIKKAAPVLSRTGLFHNAALEMAPKLAAVVASGPAAPASAAVLFGFDNDGNFHPEMAAINAALPLASKFVGNAAMRLAARTGLDNATALNVVNAGSRYATGNAVLIAQTLPGWDKMSPEEKDRAVDNILINALSGFADFQGVKAGPKRAIDYNKAATGFIQAAEAARRGETPNVPRGKPTTPDAPAPPVEPSAPVRPAEAVAEPMRAIQEVSAMEPLTFGAEITKRKGGLTGDAYRLGDRVSTEAEVAALKMAQEAAQAQSKEARGRGDFNAAIAAASKNQYFREAHEYATGTGSAAHGQRENPNYNPRFTAEGKLKGETADVPAPKPDWEVTVQNDQGEVPGFVQIVDPKATEQSKSPTMESLRAAGHEIPDFSKLPQGKYTYTEAVAKAKELSGQTIPAKPPIVDQPVNKPAEPPKPAPDAPQKYRIGNNPTTYTMVERLKASEAETANNEQPVRVKNDRTGEEQTILEQDLTPVQTRTGPDAVQPPKRRKAVMERPHDIISEIRNTVGMIRNKKGAKTGNEDSYASELYKKAQSSVGGQLFSKTGESPDVVLDRMIEAGMMKKGSTVDDLWEQIIRSSRARVATTRGETTEIQADKFYSAVSTKLAQKGSQKLTVSELSKGDKFTLNEQEFEITGIDPDTGEVTAKDGKKFGAQTIPDGAEIAVDKGSYEPAALGTFEPEGSTGAKLAPGVNQGDLVDSTQKDTLSLTGEKVIDFQRVAAEKAKTDQDAAEAKAKQDKEQQNFEGLGGAVPGEFTPSRQGATGIKNAAVDEARQARGEEPLMQPARLANPVVWDRVMARIDAEPAWQDRLILELRENPRTLTPDETLAMDHRYVDMQNDYAKTTRELAQAYDDAKQFPERAEAVPELETRLKLQSDALVDFEQITKNVGTEWGRSGQIRQRLMNEDYSLARMTILKRAENEGRDLTRAENETIARQSKEILELKAKLDAIEATKDSTGAETASKQAIPELVKEAMAEDVAQKRTRKGDTPQEARDRAESGLRSRVENGQTGPELTNVIQRLAKAFVRMGVKERVPLVDAVHGVVEQIVPGMKWRQTMDAISGYGDFRQLSKDQVSVQLRDLKGQMQQAGKLLDMFEGQAPAKTGPERRTPTDTERRLIQQVNEAKKRFGITTTDPATQLKGALQSLKTRLRNQIADLEEQLASKTRRVDERAPVPEDAESTALKGQRDKLKAEFDEMFGKPEMTDEQRVKLALASIERQSVEIERQIKQGDIFPVNRITRTPQTAAVEAAKAKRDALKLEREYLRESIQPKEKLSQEEISLKALKTRMANRIAELQDKLAKGDFSKKERKPVQMDDAAKQLSFRLEKAKQEFHEGLMKDRLARRATWKKVLDGVGEVMNVMRALKTSFDLPPIFRQGGFMTMSRPTRSIRAAGTGLQAMRPFEGKVRQHATMEEIQNRPNAPLYRSSGLYLSDRAGKLSQMEEAYRSRWATKIPGVGMSERGYTTYLNRLRADSFDALAKSLSRDGQTPTPAEAKVIANFINVATGRGRIGKNDIVGEVLDKTFFAPRYWASRIQLLTGQPIWTTSAPFKGTFRARAAVAGEYGRALAGMAVVYALAVAAGALIEKDTRSSDFGKLKFGDRRSDMMAGLQQQLVFLERWRTGETKNSRGKVVPLADQDGKKVPFGGMDTDDLWKRLFLTKLAPVPSLILDERRGKNLVGQPLTVGSRIQSAVGPMTMMDIFQAMKEEGVPTNVALSILSAFGAGMQTYPDKNPKPETPR